MSLIGRTAFISRFSILCCFLVPVIIGCGSNMGIISTSTRSGAMSGTIMGGQQPVSGATVTVWLAGTSGYGSGATQLASVTTDAGGRFQFAPNAYTCDFGNAPVYITASGGNSGGGTNASLVMGSGLGTCSTAHTAQVIINEATTAVLAYSLSHFFTTTLGGDYTTDTFGGPAAGSGAYNAGLMNAILSTIPMLADAPSGTIRGSSSALVIETAKLNSIANVIAACVNSTGAAGIHDTITACGKLFTYTTPSSGGNRPSDTLQAAVQMALYPYQNVTSLYNLGTSSPPFVGLASAPSDWTVGVAHISPAFGLAIAATSNSGSGSNLDIDATGRIWFPTNRTSAHGIAYFDPVSGTFNGPYATTLTHPQYVAVTNQGRVVGSDMSGLALASVSSSDPTIGALTYPTTGFTGPIIAASGASATESILFTGGGSATMFGQALYQETSGTTSLLTTFNHSPNSLAYYSSNGRTYVEAATSGGGTPCAFEAWDSTNGLQIALTTASSCIAGGVANTTNNLSAVMTTNSGQLCDEYNPCFTPSVPLTGSKGIAIDGDSNIWVANSTNASVSTLGYSYQTGMASDYFQTSSIAYSHNTSNGNTLTMPYGIAIDASGNVWISNAGCVSTSATYCTPSSFTLSELIGAAAPTVTPLAAQAANNSEGVRPNGINPPVTQGSPASQRR